LPDCLFAKKHLLLIIWSSLPSDKFKQIMKGGETC
jgi:hypothetical protein